MQQISTLTNFKSTFSVLLFSIFYCCIYTSTISAQLYYDINQQQPTDAKFLDLLNSNSQIYSNDTLNERILDMVHPLLADSLIEHRKQHHKVGPVGWFIHVFGGFNWRAFSMKKEKMVGTIVRQTRSRKEEFTEYDINFDINFHLDKYLHRVFEMYDKQASIKRQDIRPHHKKDYSKAPFVRDSNSIDIRKYRLHCELTPEKNYRDALNYLFYPTMPGAGGLAKHPNFEDNNPTVGFYGTLCLDCNHSCHPEMHPYEWMYWLKTTKNDTSTSREWHFGLFHEGSNRQKKWSVNPMIGQLSIPFVMQKNKKMSIYIQHGVLGQFEEKIAPSGPQSVHFDASEKSKKLILQHASDSIYVDIRFSTAIRTKGLQYWLSELNYDPELGLISGYFNIHIAIQDLYTGSIRFETLNQQ